MNIVQILGLATALADDEVARRFAAKETPLTPMEYGLLVGSAMKWTLLASEDPALKKMGEKIEEMSKAKEKV